MIASEEQAYRKGLGRAMRARRQELGWTLQHMVALHGSISPRDTAMKWARVDVAPDTSARSEGAELSALGASSRSGAVRRT